MPTATEPFDIGTFLTNILSSPSVGNALMGAITGSSVNPWETALYGRDLAGARNVRDKTKQVLPQVANIYKDLYKPLPQEQSQISQTGMLNDLLSGMTNQTGPAWDKLYGQSQKRLKDRSQQSMQDLVSQHGRDIARGGVGLLNPERRDQTIASTLARAEDESTSLSTNEVMKNLSTILGAGGSHLTNAVIPGAESERKRYAADAAQGAYNLFAPIQADQSYENALTNMMRTGNTSGVGGTGGGTAPGGMIGTALNELLKQSPNILKTLTEGVKSVFGGGTKPTNSTRPTNPSPTEIPKEIWDNIDWDDPDIFGSSGDEFALDDLWGEFDAFDLDSVDWNDSDLFGTDPWGDLEWDDFGGFDDSDPWGGLDFGDADFSDFGGFDDSDPWANIEWDDVAWDDFGLGGLGFENVDWASTDIGGLFDELGGGGDLLGGFDDYDWGGLGFADDFDWDFLDTDLGGGDLFDWF